MSGWDAWTERARNDKGENSLEGAAIYGLNGSPYSENHFKLPPDQVQMLIKCMDQGIGGSGISAVTIDGKKYFILRAGDGSLVAKCGQEGFSCSKAKTCFLVTKYTEGQQPGAANDACERVAQLLIDTGC